ncbi:MAG: hypothetical protein QG650_281, partial [Patescibacteria group bacterium]|nr:hypothetical protein [Patescibacteria group bacterium]
MRTILVKLKKFLIMRSIAKFPTNYEKSFL